MAQAKKKETAPDFMATVTGNANVEKKTAAKKQDAAIVTDAPENVREDITKLLAAKKKAKEAKSEITKAEKSILDWGKNRHDTEAFAGRFKKSFKVQGSDDDTVTFVTANKWSFSPDDVEEISEVLGDAADNLIEKDYTVKINSDVFTDEAKQKELMELLGDRWNDFFETTVSYKVAENFDEAVYNELDENGLNDLRVFMKQSKPSIR